MKKNKILVLSDLTKPSITISKLKSSVSLAKIVNADINFLYVKKPTEVVGKESQLSAMRTINKEYITVDKKIKELIEPISKNYNIDIKHTFSIGNVKSEIGKYIDDNKPDIIVLGKRKSKIVSFIGDNLTQFILDKHKGTIVIANDKNALEPDNEFCLGVFNNAKSNNSCTESIINSSQKPLTSFKIKENSNELKEENSVNAKKTVEYVFEKGDNAVKNISNYILKSNINLLLIDREQSVKDVINNLDCSLLLTS